MTIHIDVSTPQGGTLVAVLGSLRHSGSDLSRKALVQEAFGPGSGIETDALFLRFDQQLKRITAEFDDLSPERSSEALKMQIDVLSLLQVLICQPLTIRRIGQFECHREIVRLLGKLIRGGTSQDDASNVFTLWSICDEIYQ